MTKGKAPAAGSVEDGTAQRGRLPAHLGQPWRQAVPRAPGGREVLARLTFADRDEPSGRKVLVRFTSVHLLHVLSAFSSRPRPRFGAASGTVRPILHVAAERGRLDERAAAADRALERLMPRPEPGRLALRLRPSVRAPDPRQSGPRTSGPRNRIRRSVRAGSRRCAPGIRSVRPTRRDLSTRSDRTCS